MTKTELLRQYAGLESIHDQLSTELSYIHTLLQSVGFPDGLASVKMVAKELIEEKASGLGEG